MTYIYIYINDITLYIEHHIISEVKFKKLNHLSLVGIYKFKSNLCCVLVCVCVCIMRSARLIVRLSHTVCVAQ